MTSTIQVSTATAYDGYGDPVFSTSASTYQCRISEIPKLVRNFMGEEVIASNTVWVASTQSLSAIAQYSFVDYGGDTIFPNLISMERLADEDGLHHHKLYFGPTGGSGRGG